MRNVLRLMICLLLDKVRWTPEFFRCTITKPVEQIESIQTKY